MEVVGTSSVANPIYLYSPIQNFTMNPKVLAIFGAILIAYFVWNHMALNNTNNGMMPDMAMMDIGQTKGKSVGTIVAIVLGSIVFILVAFHALQYLLSINMRAYIHGLFTGAPTLDIVVDQSGYKPAPVPEIKFKKQVFNIPGNYYAYDDARAVCKAYGAELANYSQVEDAYNRGAEWCNYGWSDGQMALFPTQKKTFDYLKTVKGHENDCGRPGVNGGFIDNQKVKFGVNCYGNKPKMTQEEQELMNTIPPYPVSAQDMAFQKRVDYWKGKVAQILVSPFNHSTWSEGIFR